MKQEKAIILKTKDLANFRKRTSPRSIALFRSKNFTGLRIDFEIILKNYDHVTKI
jgi:hypothetical protein